MINKILTAKHWQLFLLTFGLPLILQFIMVGIMISHLGTGNIPDPDVMLSYMKLFSGIMILFTSLLFLWYWSVGVGLQKFIPPDLKLKVSRFRIFLLFPLMYICIFISVFMTSVNTGGPEPRIFFLILPMHLFSMFCIFYCIYFVSKTIRTAELQRNVTFSDYAGEFFLIWFYPIGIWVLQPRINRLVRGENQKAFKSAGDLLDN